jgi:hypothetical protein
MIPMGTLAFACRPKKTTPQLYWNARTGWMIAEVK